MLCPLSFAHGSTDSCIRAAAAEVTRKFPMDLLSSGIRILVYESFRSNDEPGRTESTLLCIVVDKCLLHRVQRSAASGQTLDGLDLMILRVQGENRACVHRFAVHQHRTGATLCSITN